MPNWKMDPGELLKFTFEGSDYMAIPTSIKTLLSGDVVEWARIEFKETWDAAASLKSICAFANDLDNWGGGYIVIGVQEDNGRPVFPLKGVQKDKLDSYQKNIFAKCKLLRPAYTPIIGIETYQDKHFIVIWCPGGDNRPYSSPKTMEKDNKERIHYIRKASNTVEPSDDEEKRGTSAWCYFQWKDGNLHPSHQKSHRRAQTGALSVAGNRPNRTDYGTIA